MVGYVLVLSDGTKYGYITLEYRLGYQRVSVMLIKLSL